MVKWSTTELSIEFSASSVHNRTMSLYVLYNDILWIQKPLPEGKTVWKQEIVLPAKVSLIFGNRHGVTTIVDNNGNILENMSITIESIRLDGLPSWEYWLDNCIISEVDDDDELLLGPAICTNGRVDLYFDAANAFEWTVKTKLS